MILPTPLARYDAAQQAAMQRALEQALNDLQRRVQALESTAVRVYNFVIDGGGVVITTGDKGHVTVPKGRVTGWQIDADQSGSIVVDVKKSTGGGAFSSIAGSEKPTLVAGMLASDTALTTWSPSTANGDRLGVTVDSVSTVTRVTVSLYFLPTT